MADIIGEVECAIKEYTYPFSVATNFDTEDSGLQMTLNVPAWNRYSFEHIIKEATKGAIDGKEHLRAQFYWWKEKRSLNANSYFHVLVDKIAKAIGASNEETKRRLVLDYGTPASQDGREVVVLLPKGVNAQEFYPYAKWIGDDKDDFSSQYLFYKQTHTLDKDEMAKLIDGTVQEAQALGIETRPDQEIESLINRWK